MEEKKFGEELFEVELLEEEIVKEEKLFDSSFLCEIIIMLSIITTPIYFANNIINSITTDKLWQFFVTIIYATIMMIFSMMGSAIICDKIKKLIKRIIK